MEMENEAQSNNGNDLAAPLVSSRDTFNEQEDESRQLSSLDEDGPTTNKECAADETSGGNVTALSLAMIIFYNASGASICTLAASLCLYLLSSNL